MFFGCHIFIQNRSVSLASGCWYVFVSLPSNCCWNFLLFFGKSCFVCIVLAFVDISLIFLLSPALSGLFPQVVLLFFLVSPVPFFPAYFSASLFCIILACFRSFVICVSSRISHPGFDCFFVLLGGISIFSQTNFKPT